MIGREAVSLPITLTCWIRLFPLFTQPFLPTVS